MPRNPGALSFKDEAQRAQVSETPMFGFNGKMYKTEEVMKSFEERQKQRKEQRQKLQQEQQEEQKQIEQERKEARKRQREEQEEMAKVMKERAGDVPRPRAGSSEQSMKLELVGENQAIISGQVWDNPEQVTTQQDQMPVQNTAASREVPWQGTIEETRAAQGSVSTIPDASGANDGNVTEEVSPGSVEKVSLNDQGEQDNNKRRRR
jgi:hypothetical protein